MAELGDYLGPMEPDRMTDTGMYVWAALITVATLAASFAVAVWWQRWKEKKRDA